MTLPQFGFNKLILPNVDKTGHFAIIASTYLLWDLFVFYACYLWVYCGITKGTTLLNKPQCCVVTSCWALPCNYCLILSVNCLFVKESSNSSILFLLGSPSIFLQVVAQNLCNIAV